MGFIKNWLVRWGLVICAALFAASYAFPVSWDTVLAAPALLIAAPRIHQYGIPGCIVVHRSHENPRRGLDLPAAGNAHTPEGQRVGYLAEVA